MSTDATSGGKIAPDLLVLQRFSCVERVTEIEPALSAWDLHNPTVRAPRTTTHVLPNDLS
jgi:hypothetical protein